MRAHRARRAIRARIAIWAIRRACCTRHTRRARHARRTRRTLCARCARRAPCARRAIRARIAICAIRAIRAIRAHRARRSTAPRACRAQSYTWTLRQAAANFRACSAIRRTLGLAEWHQISMLPPSVPSEGCPIHARRISPRACRVEEKGPGGGDGKGPSGGNRPSAQHGYSHPYGMAGPAAARRTGAADVGGGT